jgi:eukaryotic-like serine/threonine-protein kinase
MTPIQQRTNYPNLMSLQGTTLGGAYLLGQCLGADERTVMFKAQVKAGTPTSAIVKIYRAEPSVAEEQIALWEEIKKLEHLNLAAILGAGRTQLQEHELIYVAVERADEMLDKILRDRPLDAEEAGELVVSICRGLECLHAAGFVHGFLSPEEVLGVGDAIKLSTEGIRKASSTNDISLKDAKYHAPENVKCNVTPEADVWCLGATLFEALTQNECGADCPQDAAKLPQPFGTIVHRCLYANPEARCTLREVVQLYEGRLLAFSAAASADAGAGTRDIREAPRNSTPSSPTRTQSEPARVLPNKDSARQIYRVHTPQLHRRIWVYLAIALFLVAGLIWLARPRKSGPGGSATNKPASQQQPATVVHNAAAPVNGQPTSEAAPAQISRTLSPAPVKAGSEPSRPARHQPTTDQTHYVNGPVWRVIVYTYDLPTDAERAARLINDKHPDLKPEVFSPNGNHGPYLVVIGGQMDREKAAALRLKARRLGLPRDTYLQNYKQ